MNFSNLGSFLGGAGSVLGSVSSTLGGIFQARANRRFQAQQAELQRQFNASEAQKARDYNTKMVNEQNFYNSPSEQVKRLVSAGLHPALAYGGNGAIQNIGVGSTSSQASSSASPSGASSDWSGLSRLGSDFAQSALALSQRDVNETIRGLNEKQLFYYDRFATQGIANVASDTRLKFSLRDKTEAEIKEVTSAAENLDSLTELYNQQWLNLHTEGEILSYEAVVKRFEAVFADRTFEDRVRKYAAECDMTVKEAQTFLIGFYAQLAYTSALANLAGEQRSVAEATWKEISQKIRSGLNWKLSKMFDKQGNYYQWDMDTWYERALVSGALEFSSQLGGMFFGGKMKLPAKPVKGFGR